MDRHGDGIIGDTAIMINKDFEIYFEDELTYYVTILNVNNVNNTIVSKF